MFINVFAGTVVLRRKNIEWLPYAPPEVLLIDSEAAYKAEFHQDVWQFGVILFVCVTGCLPWQKASPSDDPRYSRYVQWHSSATGGGPGGLLAMALVSPRRRPKLFKLLTSRAQRMFRKFLEPRCEKRSVITSTPGGLTGELGKYLEDKWLEKVSESDAGTAADKDAELCPSMYSFHSSPEEKNKLLKTLTEYGVETTVDRGAKKDRIRQWIQSSAIQEDEEEEEPDDFDSLRNEDGEPYEGRERRQSSSGSGTAASH
jgi:serine/threonine-protein kinase SBK